MDSTILFGKAANMIEAINQTDNNLEYTTSYPQQTISDPYQQVNPSLIQPSATHFINSFPPHQNIAASPPAAASSNSFLNPKNVILLSGLVVFMIILLKSS